MNWKYFASLLAFLLLNSMFAATADIVTENPDLQDEIQTIVRDIYPDWSPDGQSLVFHSNRTGSVNQVFLMDIKTKNISQLTFDPTQKRNATWSPDGNHIMFTAGMDNKREIYQIDKYGKNIKRITNNNFPDYHPLWINNDQIIFDREISPKNTELFLLGQNSLISKRLTNYFERDSFGSFSPNGSKIVWRRILAEKGKKLNAELFVMNSDGSGLKRLTTHSAFDSYPHWVSDSKRIIFSSNRDGDHYEDFNIYVINSDGSGLKQLTQTLHKVEQIRARLSPDGKKIVYNRQYLNGKIDIHIMNTPDELIP